MDEFSLFSSNRHWPCSFIPETLFNHFLNRIYYRQKRKDVRLDNREDLLKALNSDEEFLEFWNFIQDQHPMKTDYFESLVNEEEPYNPGWIKDEYVEYKERKAFQALTEDRRRKLQEEFEQFRPAAYRAALEGEVRIQINDQENTVLSGFPLSKRLNRGIDEVMLTNLVIRWKPDHEEESMLARLPDQLFGRVFQFLETVDIFKMTLVCKRWKRLIDDNAMELKKAEHSLTTHLIRFTEWMDPAKTPDGETFLDQYMVFSWSLTRWFCQTSENLETLILDHQLAYSELVNLLQLCPNLRHLRIGYDVDDELFPIVMNPARVQLHKLEVFMSLSTLNHTHGRIQPCRQLYLDILVSSPTLRVFKGALDFEDMVAIDLRNPFGNVFSKLIALDLVNFTAPVLEILAQIDGMQLKYLSLDYLACNSEEDQIHDEVRARHALHQLLPKFSKLEMLRTSEYIGVTNKTIQLMIDSKLNINWAVLYHRPCPSNFEQGMNLQIDIDPVKPEVLDAFHSMLLLKNRDIDLSRIRFLIHKREQFRALKAMGTGFTVLKTKDGYSPITDEELHDRAIKGQLGINF